MNAVVGRSETGSCDRGDVARSRALSMDLVVIRSSMDVCLAFFLLPSPF
jgi:hypothetical protein